MVTVCIPFVSRNFLVTFSLLVQHVTVNLCRKYFPKEVVVCVPLLAEHSVFVEQLLSCIHYTEYFLRIQPNTSLRKFRTTMRLFGPTSISFFPKPFCQFPHVEPTKLLVAFNLLYLAMYSFSRGLLHPSCPYMPTRCRSKCRGGSCRRTVRWKGDRCVIDVCVRQISHHRRIRPEAEHNNSKILRC